MIKNNDGLVKCMTKDGRTRWIAEYITQNSKRMNNMGLTVFPSPETFLKKKIEQPEISNVVDATEMTDIVAEVEVAEKPRKPKKQ